LYIIERVIRLVTEDEDHGDDEASNGRNDESVLDRGGALFILEYEFLVFCTT